MSPLKGVITQINRGLIEILLTSGTRIKCVGKKGMLLGSRVKVFYDFTRMRVRNVELEGKSFEGSEIEPKEEEDEDTETIDPRFDYYDSLVKGQ